MKLIRFVEEERIKQGVIIEDNTILGCSSFGEDFNEDFFESNGLERFKKWLKQNSDSCPRIEKDLKLASPVARPSKLICVGLNYAKHAAESGASPPAQPVLFMKATSSIVGPNDDLIIPKGSKKTDWEVELAVVIEKKTQYVSEDTAMEYVAGYVLHNDYSEREFQLEHGGQWVKGKSADTFAPLGPFMATKDEIPDPNNLRLWLSVNGKMMQNSSTADMIFTIPQLVSYISRYMTLLPGDIISTGTPEGVGLGSSPPVYLKSGDIVELGIDGLGTSKQHVKAYPG
jgi:2-keto-4-pentenoate hydratase/2-oxohepta-3-ene-1,7-dioic acid hydratase in catechol pathway